ncbi:DUF6153 family protein [Pseudarthrobacter sp. CC4]|uniref:DUF6153 family protein n=1 Tax=Pseudarthrobacter sp. CC4 TaxID=3029190 RepID=UPI003BA32FCD
MRRGKTRPLLASLAKLALLVSVLGITAGILGMHIANAPHRTSLPTAGPNSAYFISASSSHSSSGRTTVDEVYMHAHLSNSAPEAPCLDISSCPKMGHLETSCVPAPSVTGWSAPQPGSIPTQMHPERHYAPSGATGSPFAPCPSLSELSISRT